MDVAKVGGSTRSRLVARDLKGLDRHSDDFFVATPPLEAVSAVLSMAATKSSNCPVLNTRCKEDVYIELHPEVGAELGQCGMLNFWLYGFREAASAWKVYFDEGMEEAGFRRGVGCSVIRHEEKGFRWCGP